MPYVEFDTASMPNLAAYGIAVPTMVLIVSALRHRDRIPLAVLALVGVFSVHITGGVIVVAVRCGVVAVERCGIRSGAGSPTSSTLLLIAVPTVALLLLPQFLGVLKQAEIIAGHAFVTHEGKKGAVRRGRAAHPPPQRLPDPVGADRAGCLGVVILLVRRIWWPLAVWLLLVVAIVYSSAPFGGPIGTLIGKFSDLFYSDPRRLLGGGHDAAGADGGHRDVHRASCRGRRRTRVGRAAGSPRRRWDAATAAIVAGRSASASAWHYFPRHQFLFGEKYDSVMIDAKDLEAIAYLATLPGAHDTLIGNANTDGTAWMYAVAGPASAVDPLRLSGPAGPGLSPLHLLGLRRRRRHRSASRRGGARRSTSATW